MGQAGVKEWPHHTEPPMMLSEGSGRIDQRACLTLRVNIIDPVSFASKSCPDTPEFTS